MRISMSDGDERLTGTVLSAMMLLVVVMVLYIQVYGRRKEEEV